MNGIAGRIIRLGAGLLTLVTLAWILTGQAAKPDEQQGYPTDWSHRHLVFSRPGTAQQESRIGADPRYWQQFARRNVARFLTENGRHGVDDGDFSFARFPARPTPQLHRDWAQSLGSGASVGAGNFPAKYSFQITTANCGNATVPDYVVFNTGLPGSTTQASVIAFTNLYSGCTVGTVPSIYWAYNTGGTVLTSPVISGNGAQVAFVQTDTSSHGTLVVLKFAPGGTLTVPTTLIAVPNSSYAACTAPCMTTVALQDNLGNPVDDRTSSAFPDYTHDVIWVGGASGWLHKISGVFRGVPAEVTTGGFPVQLNAGAAAVASPVYDFASNNVFVTDLGGFLYQVGPTGAVTASGRVDRGGAGVALVAGPIMDSTTSKVYVFSSNDGSTACAGTPCSAVYQFSFGFAGGSTGAKVTVGTSSATPKPMYEGSFDSAYFASGVGTGNLYVCGNTAGTPILYQIPITTGTMGTVVPGPRLTGAATGCSPVTDFSNPNVTGRPDEWIFAGVQNSGLGNFCAAGGCLMNFNVQPWTPATPYVVGQQVLDTHFQVQTVRTAGTSGAAAPAWSTTIGATTTQGAMRWVNQGPQIASHPAWVPTHAYARFFAILDSNGNVQVATVGGTSKFGGHPTWQTIVNRTTADGTVTWRNVGLPATVSFAAAGGTSGIIIDNTVPIGTTAGASEVYFSTQSNQPTCGASALVGCAVQVSQAALQ